MAISVADMKVLWARAGNQCSMPGCPETLATERGTIGEIAHIVPRSPQGPRGTGSPGADSYGNLILLCPRHHKEVDANPLEWTSERLHQIKRLHESTITSVMTNLWRHLPNAGTVLVFCGASSVGKDVVASRVRRALLSRFGHEVEFLDKYTTRPPRTENEGASRETKILGSLYEPSSTYEFLSIDRFDTNPDCFFPYRKYGNYRYAFSRRHLLSTDSEDRNLACILGALHRVEDFRTAIERDLNRAVITVLLEAELDELNDRLDLRSTFNPEQRERRRAEIAKDLRRIERIKSATPKTRDAFDLMADNGTTSLRQVVDFVSERIGQWLMWKDWSRDSDTPLLLSRFDSIKPDVG